jgi:hypothetical protein
VVACAAVPHSGWPFGFDKLLPHYERAHALLGLGPFDYDASAWERASGGAQLPLDGRAFSSILFRRAPVNFGASMRAMLTRSDRLQLLLYLHALRGRPFHASSFQVRRRRKHLTFGRPGFASRRLRADNLPRQS